MKTMFNDQIKAMNTSTFLNTYRDFVLWTFEIFSSYFETYIDLSPTVVRPLCSSALEGIFSFCLIDHSSSVSYCVGV